MTKKTLYANTATAALIAAVALSATSAHAQDSATIVVPDPTTTVAVPVQQTPTAPPPRTTTPRSAAQNGLRLSDSVLTQPTTRSDTAVTPAAGIGDPASSTPVNPAAIAQVEAQRAAAARARQAAPSQDLAAATPTRSTSSQPAAATGTNTSNIDISLPEAALASAETSLADVGQAAQTSGTAPQTSAAPTDDTVTASVPANSGNGLFWGGLAALVLLGGAGAGIAFSRRKRPVDAREAVAEPVIARKPQPLPADWTVVEATTAEQGTVRAMCKPEPAEPVAAKPALDDRAQARASATPVVAPGASYVAGRHEAEALRGPTPDNPFLTRKARLKRARFYDRRERLAAEASQSRPDEAIAQPEPVAARAQAEAPQGKRTTVTAQLAKARDKAASIADPAAWNVGGFKPSYSG